MAMRTVITTLVGFLLTLLAILATASADVRNTGRGPTILETVPVGNLTENAIGANILVISLPELTGEYEEGQHKTVLLDPADWAFRVETVYLRLSGDLKAGQTDFFAIQPQLEVGISSNPNGFVSIYSQEGEGVLAADILLSVPVPGLDEFLVEEPGYITVYFPPLFGAPPMTIPPSMSIDEAQLVLYGEVIESATLLVEIDIKPGRHPNSINLKSRGVIPVAILTTDEFDATTVDPNTVELAGAGVAIRGKGKLRARKKDVDKDGDLDLLVHVKTKDLDIEPGTTAVTLTGETYDGTPIEGSDDIVIISKRLLGTQPAPAIPNRRRYRFWRWANWR